MASVASKKSVTEKAFARAQKIAIIAGGGQIPVMLAQQLSEHDQEPFVIMLDGDADESLTRYKHIRVNTAALGALTAAIKREKITEIVIVGAVKGRPSWRDFQPDWSTLKLVGKIINGLRSGDDALLSSVVSVIEETGVDVVGVHDLMPEMLAPKGVIAGAKPNASMLNSIQTGVEAALALGALDIGQACVVIGKRVVALEGAEGTDEMLARVADLRERGKLPAKKSGVLVKLCKPQQDKRVDMPTIGIATVENANKADLSGIALHAGNALIVDIEGVINRAKTESMFIYGVEPKNDDRQAQ